MVKKSLRKSLSPIKVPKATAGDRPATRRMLHIVRDELRGEFGIVRDEIKQVRNELKADIHRLSAEIGEVKVIVHRISLLVEEQNANNRIVLEGLQTLWQRQERLEERHYR